MQIGYPVNLIDTVVGEIHVKVYGNQAVSLRAQATNRPSQMRGIKK